MSEPFKNDFFQARKGYTNGHGQAKNKHSLTGGMGLLFRANPRMVSKSRRSWQMSSAILPMVKMHVVGVVFRVNDDGNLCNTGRTFHIL